MADTLQNQSSGQFQNLDSQQTSSQPQSTIPESFYSSPLLNIFLNNKLTDAQAAVKQIAKILKSVRSTDKKSRQQPMQGIIMKKFVLGIQGGLDLMKTFGFEESTVDNKPYLVLGEDHTTVADSDTIAESLLAIAATNPLDVPKLSTTMSDDTSEKSTTDLSETAGDASTLVDTDEEKQDKEPEPPAKCSTGCGFFANSAFNGMCSSCHKKTAKPVSKIEPLSTPSVPAGLSPITPFGFSKFRAPTSNLFGVTPATKALTARLQKGFCSTTNCNFIQWKDAPPTWLNDLNSIKKKQLQQVQDETHKSEATTPDTSSTTTPVTSNDMSDEIITTPSQSSPVTDETIPSIIADAATDDAVVDTKPPTTCQYCTYTAYLKPASAQTRTLSQKKHSFKLKCQALYGFEKVMREVQKDKARCWSCNRKLGIAGVECRCGFVFCGHHRYPNLHECNYDHMKHYTDNLAKTTLNDITRGKLDDREYE